ncbi:MAG TPA: GIY-YIG nuclease family protein [Planctomycetes bacterium]|nr:GIY-YIG nuclease family protein [Planctomycetota bacterium]
MWSVYLLRMRTGALYTGIALDVERRLAEHRSGSGAKCLRGKGPLELVFEREIGDRGEALRVEAMLKRLSKDEKEAIAAGEVSSEELLARLAPRA